MFQRNAGPSPRNEDPASRASLPEAGLAVGSADRCRCRGPHGKWEQRWATSASAEPASQEPLVFPVSDPRASPQPQAALSLEPSREGAFGAGALDAVLSRGAQHTTVTLTPGAYAVLMAQMSTSIRKCPSAHAPRQDCGQPGSGGPLLPPVPSRRGESGLRLEGRPDATGKVCARTRSFCRNFHFRAGTRSPWPPILGPAGDPGLGGLTSV